MTGGGLVPGSVMLIGGDPGIGKSTLLIQACAALARQGGRVVYISGEESVAQVRLRAARLGLAGAACSSPRRPASRTSSRRSDSGDRADLSSIDSIQTMWSEPLESAPGTVSAGARLGAGADPLRQASGAAIILVGHVTKDGQIAGPRVVEHMVDAVLSFEGEGGTPSASCAPRRTASAPPTRSASSR